VVDGSGRPRFSADIGIQNGRIIGVDRLAQKARETIDASGLIVSPGFIDLHTHYDAQVFWDPRLTPSCLHGVTTVLGGFCGFSIAPLSPEASNYLMKMLARVEGMPLETLQRAVPWNWRSFGQFLANIEGRIGLNAGFFAGHSAIRAVVMGERAVGNKCGVRELQRMKGLLDVSLAEGALGFSTTISPSHNDSDGNPVPSRWADHSEIIELATVVRNHEGTALELLPDVRFGPETVELITHFSLAGQRPVNWNALFVTEQPGMAERAARQLAVSDHARARGGEVLALTMPCAPRTYLNFKSGMVLDLIPGIWCELFKLPLQERIVALRDPATRSQMGVALRGVPSDSVTAPFFHIDEYLVATVSCDSNRKYQGRRVGEIAHEEGRASLDVLLDIVVRDELATILAPEIGGRSHESFELAGKLWRDDRTLVGASDAGAHMDMIDTFAFATTLLEKGVREHAVITLEEAVHQLTHRPARYMGLVDRGLLAPGYHADIVIFDAASVGPGPTYPRHDVPGNQMRLYAEAIGIAHVLVNGVEIVRQGIHTGKLPGTVLHSGRDTRTVAMDAMRAGKPAA
jgi:N-acyl-D-aspartate/D-glutamate deacylase